MVEKKYAKGQIVKVSYIFPPGHVRTPYFVRGFKGIIDHFWGFFPNPEKLAYGQNGMPEKALYRVEFLQSFLWTNYKGSKSDKLYVDLYEHWLENI